MRAGSCKSAEEAGRPTRQGGMRALILAILLGTPASPAVGQSLQLVGYAGELGEWELTAAVTERASWWTKEFSGPLMMKHVGICTPDGPEERTGEIWFQLSAWSGRLNARLSFPGTTCTYIGKMSDAYTGIMSCPDRQAIPLKLWLK
jgi:hypothetical protein